MSQTKCPSTHGMFQTCIKQQWASHITFFHTTLNEECFPSHILCLIAIHCCQKYQIWQNTPCDPEAPNNAKYSIGRMFSSNQRLQTKQGNSIPKSCCKRFPIPRRHPLHLCMVGIHRDLWTDVLQCWPRSFANILFVIVSIATGRQLLSESKTPPWGNIVYIL